MKGGVFLLFIYLMFGISFAYTYAPSVRDVKLMQKLEGKIRIYSEEGGKERLVPLFGQVEEQRKDAENEHTVFILNYLMSIIKKYLMKHGVRIKKTASRNIVIKKDKQKNEGKTLEKKEVLSNHNLSYIGKKIGYISDNIKRFYEDNKDKLTDNTPISDLCTKYYDKIDALAKEYNFPTSLIIATRYREHTCVFDNPTNERGNFQITTAYYEPGPITWSDFKQQVIDFMNFSRKKWARYETFRKFDKIPVQLDYTHIDLLSIQKHSILYNGLRVGNTPQNNLYANENFDQEKSGRDGIVAMTLKVIGWALEHSKATIKTKQQRDREKNTEVGVLQNKKFHQEVMDKKNNEKCIDIFTTNLTKGSKGEDVQKMQSFLKKEGFFLSKITGYYGDITEQSVNAFQAYYKSDILDPGGYTEPTGNWYPATRRKANQIKCNY